MRSSRCYRGVSSCFSPIATVLASIAFCACNGHCPDSTSLKTRDERRARANEANSSTDRISASATESNKAAQVTSKSGVKGSDPHSNLGYGDGAGSSSPPADTDGTADIGQRKTGIPPAATESSVKAHPAERGFGVDSTPLTSPPKGPGGTPDGSA